MLAPVVTYANILYLYHSLLTFSSKADYETTETGVTLVEDYGDFGKVGYKYNRVEEENETDDGFFT